MQPFLALQAGASPFDLSRYLTLVGVLIAAIVLLGYGFKRLARNAIQKRTDGRTLRVIDVLPLGGKHKLAIVRVYDRTFALGLGGQEVNLLAELDPVETQTEEKTRDGFEDLIERAQKRLQGQRPMVSSVRELFG